VMKILKNVQNCRTHVWSYYHTTRKHLRGRTEAEINITWGDIRVWQTRYSRNHSQRSWSN
jgi:hypothetical protein